MLLTIIGVLFFIAVVRAEPIVHGDIVERYPYVVYIDVRCEEYNFNTGIKNTYNMACGGTIIRPKTVLTAAHCLANSIVEPDAIVIAGVLKMEHFSKGQQRQMDDYEIHPDFHNGNTDDIALVILEEPFSIVFGLVAVAEIGVPKLGQYTTAIGWGNIEEAQISDALRMIKMKIVKKSLCSSQFNQNHFIICVWADNRKSTPCIGDSGGPLVLDGKVVGIASTIGSYVSVATPGETHLFCDGDKPVVYVNISKFLNWINKYAQ